MKATLFFCIGLLPYFVAAGPWYQKADFPGDARHRSTAFSIGNWGYIGLGHINSAVDEEYEDFWRYDPSSNSWSQIANYPEGKCYHAASFVVGTKAYVGTGRLTNGSYSNHFYEYNPQTNSWTSIANFPGVARRGAVGFSIGLNGYVGTGQSSSGYTKNFFQYNTQTDQWMQIQDLPGLARTSSVGFTIGNFGYVGTGDLTAGAGNDFYQYNPTLNQWIQKANVGPTPRQEAAGFSVGGKGYIGTGDDFSSGNNYGDFWEYDPTMDTWIQISDFDGTARRYLVALTIGNRAYVGTGTNGINFKDFWMFDKILALAEAELQNVMIRLYPNPMTDHLTIDLEHVSDELQLSDFKFDMFDLLGRNVGSYEVTEKKFKVETTNLQKSMYTYSISYQNTKLKSGKLLIGN